MTDKKRKRSGISIERASRIQERLIARAADIFRSAIVLKYTSEHIAERVGELYNDPDFDRVPQYVQGHIEGYIRAKQESLLADKIADEGELVYRAAQRISHDNIGAAILHAAETGLRVSGVVSVDDDMLRTRTEAIPGGNGERRYVR